MSFELARSRPAWQLHAHRAALGFALLFKALEGCVVGRMSIYDGSAFSVGLFTEPLGRATYVALVVAQLAGVLALFSERLPRVLVVVAALAFSLDMCVDFQNTRLFLSVMLWLVVCAPRVDPRAEQVVAWHMDATAWQLGIVYLSTVLHKLNPSFLSGRTLHNLAHMPDAILGPVSYLEDMQLAAVASYLVVLLELAIPILLLASDRTRPYGIALAVALHVGMAVTLPAVSSFTVAVFASLYACLPTQQPQSGSSSSLVQLAARWCHSPSMALPGQTLWALTTPMRRRVEP